MTEPAVKNEVASGLTGVACGSEDSVHRLAAELNQRCFCITLDRDALAVAMRDAAGDSAFYDAHVASRQHLFSNVPVFLPDNERIAMLAIVHAIEETARLPAYKDAALAWASPSSRSDLGPIGAMMGYDFHLGDGPPRLIEINTNAGGALLNAFSARAQITCCPEVEGAKHGSTVAGFEASFVAMFESEWRRQRERGRPARIAIVDDTPAEQYLYPEFVLARRLFEAHGIEAVIADPSDLTYVDRELRSGERRIDLVYNRLVDFALSEQRHAALRQAFLDGAAVITPNPYNHALFADKRNLTLLSDQTRLRSWGVSPATAEALSTLPRAVLVTPANAEALWADRKRLFFKPASGHGGKAVYRGDKITRSVWADIPGADYIAQELAPPGERQVLVDGAPLLRKMDVRLYTYDGEILLAAARLYQGQTTNFRTEGGGFAPVFFIAA